MRKDHVETGHKVVTALVMLSFAIPAALTRAEEVPGKPKRPPIYDTGADGSKQIADALAVARRDHKRVLLQFGADWCIWCHRMHEVLESDKAISKTMQYEYELVLVDVDDVDGKRHNDAIDKRYGRPTRHGLPAWVVLSAEGRQLATIKTETLELGDGYDTAKVLATLEKWKAKPRSAEAVLSSALSQAKSQSKNVFVHFSAPWCAWCKRMDEYLHRGEVAAVFNSAFVPVKIDEDRMDGGQELKEKYGATEDDGIPYWVVLDPAGKKLADSHSPEGNVGFPAEPHEIAHFMKVLRTCAGRLTPAQLDRLEKGLQK